MLLAARMTSSSVASGRPKAMLSRTVPRSSTVSCSAGYGHDDNALTFFFQANPAEAVARLRVIAEFRPSGSARLGGSCCPADRPALPPEKCHQ